MRILIYLVLIGFNVTTGQTKVCTGNSAGVCNELNPGPSCAIDEVTILDNEDEEIQRTSFSVYPVSYEHTGASSNFFVRALTSHHLDASADKYSSKCAGELKVLFTEPGEKSVRVEVKQLKFNRIISSSDSKRVIFDNAPLDLKVSSVYFEKNGQEYPFHPSVITPVVDKLWIQTVIEDPIPKVAKDKIRLMVREKSGTHPIQLVEGQSANGRDFLFEIDMKDWPVGVFNMELSAWDNPETKYQDGSPANQSNLIEFAMIRRSSLMDLGHEETSADEHSNDNSYMGGVYTVLNNPGEFELYTNLDMQTAYQLGSEYGIAHVRNNLVDYDLVTLASYQAAIQQAYENGVQDSLQLGENLESVPEGILSMIRSSAVEDGIQKVLANPEDYNLLLNRAVDDDYMNSLTPGWHLVTRLKGSLQDFLHRHPQVERVFSYSGNQWMGHANGQGPVDNHSGQFTELLEDQSYWVHISYVQNVRAELNGNVLSVFYDMSNKDNLSSPIELFYKKEKKWIVANPVVGDTQPVPDKTNHSIHWEMSDEILQSICDSRIRLQTFVKAKLNRSSAVVVCGD